MITMAFNKNISGVGNEIEFVQFLNMKRVWQLNPMFLSFLEDLFGRLKENDIIYCWKNDKPEKSDIFLKVQGVTKGVSIKRGIKNSVHVERISDFIHFLIKNNIQKDIIEKYLRYHYADGTLNGSGHRRLSASEYKILHQDEIDQINTAFCQKELMEKVVSRFLLQGQYKTGKADVILFGVIDDFIWIKAEDIKRIVLEKRNVYSSAVHFGPLTCQPMDRCLNYNPLYEKKRFCIQIK